MNCLNDYRMPGICLLRDYPDQMPDVSREEVERNGELIKTVLEAYKIDGLDISVCSGPVNFTLYEVKPARRVRESQIKGLENDIAFSLGKRGVRVLLHVETKTINIEVPNDEQGIVSMCSVLSDYEFITAKYDLPVVIGRTVFCGAYSFDLAEMPHLLVAGSTGQGKSVCLHAIITSLLYRKRPEELKFVLIDPKKSELSQYAPLKKHYLARMPDSDNAVITDTRQAVYTLRSLCRLMYLRYDLLKAASVHDIKEYNKTGRESMPYIVVVIDEFADLMITAGREVEEPIARLARLAKAVGIHLVIATQRPTTNIITGTIKANFPARIAFRVMSVVDSNTILDRTGAEQLIGRGDMLVSIGNSGPVRLQCAFIDAPEVEGIVSFIAAQDGFGGAYLLPECDKDDSSGGNYD